MAGANRPQQDKSGVPRASAVRGRGADSQGGRGQRRASRRATAGAGWPSLSGLSLSVVFVSPDDKRPTKAPQEGCSRTPSDAKGIL